MSQTISQAVTHQVRNQFGLEFLPTEIKKSLIGDIEFARAELRKQGYLLPPPAASAFLVLKALYSGAVPVIYRKQGGCYRLSLFEDESDWLVEIAEL